MKTANSKKNLMGDGYLDLIRQFPLRSIRSETDYEGAGLILNRLLGREFPPLSQGEEQYLNALVELSLAYEGRAHKLGGKKVLPRDIARHLMEENNMNTEALGRVLGSQTAASLFLNGKRSLSKANIFKLAERFKVEPSLFLEKP
jgi:antitoxin component HigA of HigAB toxin-antitoxin module